MRPHSRLAGLTLLCAFAGAGRVHAESVTVLDITRATATEVEQLKRMPEGTSWLEMDRQLVIIGAHGFEPSATESTRVLARWDDVDAAQLRLRARGCSEHSSEAGRLLARGGRWELRELSPAEAKRLDRSEPEAWRAVRPDTVLARRARSDALPMRASADPRVQAVVDRIDAARWFADLETLSAWDRSSYATTSLAASRDWIAAQFAELGLEVATPAFTMNSPRGTITRHNVVGTWTGSGQPERWVVVGAHYDSRNAVASATLGTPGAEDNASGCAGVIELARALLPSQPLRSIQFICYAGEEQGLIGSQAHVQALQAAGDLDQVDLVVIMDMIGYSADADLEALFESTAGQAAYLDRFTAMAATYAPELATVISYDPFGSDHMPYINAGLRAALAIENDWDIYPHYHQSTDVPANLGPHAQAMGAAILKTNAALIADLGGVAPAVFGDGFEGVP
jgi:hypothetical protein